MAVEPCSNIKPCHIGDTAARRRKKMKCTVDGALGD